jgi:hypothetical protein
VIPRLVILLGGGEVVGGATKSSFQLHMLKEYKIEAHIFEIGLKNSLQAQDNIIHLRDMYPCGLFIHCNLLRLWLQTIQMTFYFLWNECKSKVIDYQTRHQNIANKFMLNFD